MTGTAALAKQSKPQLGVVTWLPLADHEAAKQTLAQMSAMGIGHLRLGVSWADYHRPGGPEWFRWLIPTLASEVELMPCVTYTPPSLGEVYSSAAPPTPLRAYADFLDLFVTDYGRYFDWIELWNEPNNLLDWNWRLDPDWQKFFQMIGAAAYWMRQRDKRTVLGGTCPTDLHWLEKIRQSGALAYIDAVGVHAFPGTWTHDFPGWEKEIQAVRQVLEHCPEPVEVWITETGFSTWRYQEFEQLRQLAEALAAPVDRVYWYGLFDLREDQSSQEGWHFDERHYHMGLLKQDGREKLAGRLLRQGGAAAVEAGATKWCSSSGAAPSVLTSGKSPVLITGGAGFLGCNLANALASRGETVLLLDNLSRPGVTQNLDWLLARHGERIIWTAADIRDPWQLNELVKDVRAVLHLAAQAAVTSSVKWPLDDFNNNTLGTLHLLEALRRHNPSAPLVFASTNKVYGNFLADAEVRDEGSGYRPLGGAFADGVNEAQPLDFHSPYGCSKGAAEQYVRDYGRIYGLPTRILRMSCIYGPHQHGSEDQGWVTHFLISALRREPITLYGDGAQVRDILHVDDAVRAWLAVMVNPSLAPGSIFNLGGGPANAISLRHCLELIAALQAEPPLLKYADWRSGDQRWYVSDTRALQRALGWRPSIAAQDGVRQLYQWLAPRYRLPTQFQAEDKPAQETRV